MNLMKVLEFSKGVLLHEQHKRYPAFHRKHFMLCHNKQYIDGCVIL